MEVEIHNAGYLIGLDFGTELARGVLLDVQTGKVADTLAIGYTHGVMTEALPDGVRLPSRWALQDASDYTEAAAVLLSALGRRRNVHGIGIGFTASSPLPARADGSPLSAWFPDRPHAYVKLWKHQAAQGWADRIGISGGPFLDNFGGKVSGSGCSPRPHSLPRKRRTSGGRLRVSSRPATGWSGNLRVGRRAAAGLLHTRPSISPEPDIRTSCPACWKSSGAPSPIGTSAGPLTDAWRERTGIEGSAAVGVAAIDSHVVMPAVGGCARACSSAPSAPRRCFFSSTIRAVRFRLE